MAMMPAQSACKPYLHACACRVVQLHIQHSCSVASIHKQLFLIGSLRIAAKRQSYMADMSKVEVYTRCMPRPAEAEAGGLLVVMEVPVLAAQVRAGAEGGRAGRAQRCAARGVRRAGGAPDWAHAGAHAALERGLPGALRLTFSLPCMQAPSRRCTIRMHVLWRRDRGRSRDAPMQSCEGQQGKAALALMRGGCELMHTCMRLRRCCTQSWRTCSGCCRSTGARCCARTVMRSSCSRRWQPEGAAVMRCSD